jgi:hypothetical protein
MVFSNLFIFYMGLSIFTLTFLGYLFRVHPNGARAAWMPEKTVIRHGSQMLDND